MQQLLICHVLKKNQPATKLTVLIIRIFISKQASQTLLELADYRHFGIL